MNWIDIINRMEDELLFNEELQHFYLFKMESGEFGIVEDGQYEIIKYLDGEDIYILNNINEYIYRCEDYDEVVDYAKEVYNFKWWRKVVIDLGG